MGRTKGQPVRGPIEGGQDSNVLVVRVAHEGGTERISVDVNATTAAQLTERLAETIKLGNAGPASFRLRLADGPRGSGGVGTLLKADVLLEAQGVRENGTMLRLEAARGTANETTSSRATAKAKKNKASRAKCSGATSAKRTSGVVIPKASDGVGVGASGDHKKKRKRAAEAITAFDNVSRQVDKLRSMLALGMAAATGRDVAGRIEQAHVATRATLYREQAACGEEGGWATAVRVPTAAERSAGRGALTVEYGGRSAEAYRDRCALLNEHDIIGVFAALLSRAGGIATTNKGNGVGAEGGRRPRREASSPKRLLTIEGLAQRAPTLLWSLCIAATAEREGGHSSTTDGPEAAAAASSSMFMPGRPALQETLDAIVQKATVVAADDTE